MTVAMTRRWSLALGLSLLAHLAVVVVALGLGAHRFTGPIDVEITGMRLDEVKDLPLGGPAGQGGPGHAPRRPHHRATPPAEGTLAARADKEENAGRTSPEDDQGGPAPTSDLSAYGPRGSRLTVLLRLDRLRGTDYVAPVDSLLQRLPDRRDLLEGTDLDLFQSFDALLIATPHPLDPTVTFLAARHRLTDAALKAALTRGARATDRAIAWRLENGHPVAERRPHHGSTTYSAAVRDERLIILAAPGLAVVTPPAYRRILLPSHDGTAPDGGTTAPDGGAAPDGGVPAPLDWTKMLERIDAEEGLMPADGVAMINAVDIFKTSGGVPPILYGLEVPAAVNAVIGLEGEQPFADVRGEFTDEAPARHWEDEWPTLQRKLRGNPLVMLGGFSPLIERVSLTRDGKVVHVHLSASHDEATRLLALALHMLGGG